ncbi:hypothetical protein ACHAWF_011523 [Thalassiosira exigua]
MPSISIEETNLGGVGSAEDSAAREAAARMEFHWDESVGSAPGVEIWRVENKRAESGAPDFGIAPWPKERRGQFHRGDSYVVLETAKDPAGDKLLHDVYFWIGSQSTQDEYGVAAYKVVELDELLGGEPVQHREVEGRESRGFAGCFPKGIAYLEGGVDSGFRQVSNRGGASDFADVERLYRVQKKPGGRAARIAEVPLARSSLNDGDAFLLDAGTKICTWFGSTVSAFEKSKSASVAHNLRENRLGDCECVLDVEDDDDEFWDLLGGRGEVRPAEEDAPEPEGSTEKKMYVVSDAEGPTRAKEVPLAKSSLVSDDVCIVDAGDDAYVWIGSGSTRGEKQQAMLLVDRYLKAMSRRESTCVTRVLEGQEGRCKAFMEVF